MEEKMSWDSIFSRSEEGPLGLVISICVILVIFTLAVFLLNPFGQAKRLFDETIDADNVIYNYEWFKQQHEDVQAIDAKILDADSNLASFKKELGDRADWHREDREEVSRLNAVCLGLKNQRADMVSEYNARSRMANRSIFKANDVNLPKEIVQ